MREFKCYICGRTFVVHNTQGYLYKAYRKDDKGKNKAVKYCCYDCYQKDNNDNHYIVKDHLKNKYEY